MKTKLIKDRVEDASAIIRSGGLVAVPTETVYGLAGNGLNHETVERIYDLKGRPEIKPLPLMVPGGDAIFLYCEDVPEQALTLASKFWPGPLTIILKSRHEIPEIVRAGGETVGLRCPDHPLTLELLRSCGLPLAAPSANPSSKASPKTATEVMSYFEGRIEAVIDGGECGIGRESTIIDMSSTPYRILRHGALPEVEITAALEDAMTIIGITGGSGTGKTTALDTLANMDCLCIDCDELYHKLTRESAKLRIALEARFGSVYKDEELDRKALGKCVFSDPKALLDLNEITHCAVGNELNRLICEHAMNGGKLVAIDAVALCEGGVANRCDVLFGIIAPNEARIERIMAREGISTEYAQLRINAQQKDDYYEKRCNKLLVNSGTKADFAAQCEAAFKEVI